MDQIRNRDKPTAVLILWLGEIHLPRCLLQPHPDVNIGQVEWPLILLSDGGGNTLWVMLPWRQNRLNVVGCVLPNLEAWGVLWLVGLTQSSHDCVHILHAPHGSNFLHDLNCFFKEWVGHGAEIEPLCLSQAGSTEWMGQLPSLWLWWVSCCQWFSDSWEIRQVLWHWSPRESNIWGRQLNTRGWAQGSVFHHEFVYCNSVQHPLPLLMKGGVCQWMTCQLWQVVLF